MVTIYWRFYVCLKKTFFATKIVEFVKILCPSLFSRREVATHTPIDPKVGKKKANETLYNEL